MLIYPLDGISYQVDLSLYQLADQDNHILAR